MNTTGGSKRIGKGNANSYWLKGFLDDVRIYNYARTPAQIAWDYNRGKPVAEWKFDECQGATANDSSGNGNNGTITIGATAPQSAIGTCTDGLLTSAWYNGRTGKYNSSMSFDGVDDYVDVGTITIADNTPWTISTWINMSDTAQGFIYGNAYVAGDYSRFFYWPPDPGFRLYNENNTELDFTFSSALSSDTWYHIVLVSDGSTTANLDLYVNGIERASNSIADSSQIIKKIGNIGSTANSFKGMIDDVKIFNYALTAEQVKMEYNGGAVSFR